MTWITIKLMQFQLYRITKQKAKLDSVIIAQAYVNMLKTYNDTIMFLKANK